MSKSKSISSERYFILDGKKPVLCGNSREWAEWMETADTHRIVNFSQIKKGIEISTVFLGINHNFIEKDPPILFETVIFGGNRNGETWRYSTWKEAEEGHKNILKELNE